ncbi:MAG: flavodoxin domain-containing protein [Promethearchaeota archaeon]
METTLIVYASKYGSTREIVELVARVLGPAKICTPNDCNPDEVDASFVLLASPVYSDRLAPAVVEFATRHREWLRGRRVALLCVSMSGTTAESTIGPITTVLGECVVWTGGTRGRMLLDRLSDGDRKAIERFSQVTGLPLEDDEGVSKAEVVSMAMELRAVRDEGARGMPPGELKKEVTLFLKAHNTCALATASCVGEARVRCTPIEYAFDAGKLYLVSEGGEKFAHLAVNSRVSLAIFEPYTSMQDIKGAQVTGFAEVASPGSSEHARAFELKGLSPQAIAKLPFDLYVVVVTVERVEFTSSSFRERGFQTRQVLVVEGGW